MKSTFTQIEVDEVNILGEQRWRVRWLDPDGLGGAVATGKR